MEFQEGRQTAIQERAAEQVRMNFTALDMTLDRRVEHDLTYIRGFAGINRLYLDRGLVEIQLKQMKYGDEESIHGLLQQIYRGRKSTYLDSASLYEWRQFLRAHETVSDETHNAAGLLAEHGTMNLVDAISFYVGIFRYHRLVSDLVQGMPPEVMSFDHLVRLAIGMALPVKADQMPEEIDVETLTRLARTEQPRQYLRISRGDAEFLEVNPLYIPILYGQLKKLNAAGMILKMANWGRYTRGIQASSKIAKQLASGRYLRDPPRS